MGGEGVRQNVSSGMGETLKTPYHLQSIYGLVWSKSILHLSQAFCTFFRAAGYGSRQFGIFHSGTSNVVLSHFIHSEFHFSFQFNYMFDIPWLIDKYPSKARKRPILIVTAARNQAESQVIRSDILNSNEKNGTTITVALARLPIAYGTHHTKMMILKYTTGIRIIVHTANMIPEDWDQKTQG